MPSGYPGSAQLACPDCGGRKAATGSARCKPCADIAKRSLGPCSVEGCERDSKTNGMCKSHAEKARRLALPFRACDIEGCPRDARLGNAGMCPMHYARKQRNGTPSEGALSRRPNGAGGERQELRRSYEATRLSRKRGQFVEHVDLATVWERDAGMCHICRLPAERWNWHLDHVVPIARGGLHSYANVAVAHPGCNLRKGDR